MIGIICFDSAQHDMRVRLSVVEAVLRFALYERDFIMIIKIFTFAPQT